MVWYDAHGDINTMATTETGLWGGMPYAVALGWDLDDWRQAAGLSEPIAARAAALFGTSDLDPAELAAIAREGLAHLDARDLNGPAVRAVLGPRRAAAPAWYLHIDMDVAGPEVPGVNTPAPYWPARDRLIEAVGETARTVPLAAFSLAAVNPLGDPDGRSARLGNDLAVAIADAIAAGR
jgi:arginase